MLFGPSCENVSYDEKHFISCGKTHCILRNFSVIIYDQIYIYSEEETKEPNRNKTEFNYYSLCFYQPFHLKEPRVVVQIINIIITKIKTEKILYSI